MNRLFKTAALSLTFSGMTLAGAQAAKTEVTGELIDTWCYLSEVMGAGEAITGSAHHQCAVWCAAGGIPVGLLSEDGTVYFILTVDGEDSSVANDSLLDIQSHRITAAGEVHERDGLKYLLIDKIVSNDGLVNKNHEDFGVIPDFGVPKK